MSDRSRRYVVDFEGDDDGLWYSVNGGEPRGPFACDLDRDQDLRQAISNVAREARTQGGYVVQIGESAWHLELPADVADRRAA